MERRSIFHSDYAIPCLIEKDAEELYNEQCIDLVNMLYKLYSPWGVINIL